MNSYLLYKDRDFPWDKEINEEMKTVYRDLEMNTIFQIMADNNKDVYVSISKVFSQILTKPEQIYYRQNILKDCIKNYWIFYEIDRIFRNIEAQQSWLNKRFGLLKDYPTSVMSISTEMIQIFVESLNRLKQLFKENESSFKSEGFRNLMRQLDEEINDNFIKEVYSHLEKLNFEDGILVNATVGEGLKATNYIISDATEVKTGWVKNIFKSKTDKDVIQIKFKNDNNARALSDLKEQALSRTANILHQTVDHFNHFFQMFEMEMNFYKGLTNLKRFFDDSKLILSFPEIIEEYIQIDNLFDVSLAIIEGNVTSNNFNSEGKPLVFITGANQGGKTTFLRSLGQVILMSQAGSFVGAKSCQIKAYEDIFTFFRKEEDDEEESGKFDEELKRFSGIVEFIKPDSCLLMNEPFASTNEKEATEIGFNIIRALIENRISVFCVTHLFSLTNKFSDKLDQTIFLRAQRDQGGIRSFKITPQEPLKTGFGIDLYNQIFS